MQGLLQGLLQRRLQSLLQGRQQRRDESDRLNAAVETQRFEEIIGAFIKSNFADYAVVKHRRPWKANLKLPVPSPLKKRCTA
ncbi:MAG: hypothetical protein ACI9WS_000091 [Paraglaciecola psychrophila]